MTTRRQGQMGWFLPFVVILLGAGTYLGLVRTRPKPQRAERQDRGVLVEVTQVTAKQLPVTIRAHGTVTAAQKIELSPQVFGRVLWQSPELLPGGHFRTGEPALRIDPVDYELAVQESAAAVDKAELELKLELGRQRVAHKAWKLLGDEETIEEDGRSLALREPQLRSARVAQRAAESTLKRAQINLARTTVRIPFNALVLSESVDVGQLVSPTSKVATLVGTDRAWVQVPVPMQQVPRIALPGGPGNRQGARAKVWLDVGQRRAERQGHVLRLLADLDPVGAMARVLVELKDPFDLRRDATEPARPLLLGALVNVEIDAGMLDNVIELPRLALHEGNRVYVLSDENTLLIRDVEVVWRLETTVLIRDGLKNGDRVITSRIPTPLPGMRLRTSALPHPDRGTTATTRGVR